MLVLTFQIAQLTLPFLLPALSATTCIILPIAETVALPFLLVFAAHQMESLMFAQLAAVDFWL